MGSVRIRVKIISIFQEKLCRNWIRRRMTQNSNRNHRIGPAGTLEVRNQPFTHQLALSTASRYECTRSTIVSYQSKESTFGTYDPYYS
eukprot:COSAG02_NODE_1856_length_10648_cov_8.834581_1_plen_88_part_00